jgi:hypothetical protein
VIREKVAGMERVLVRILFTFSAGFFVIGLIVGLLKVNTEEYCGAVLSHPADCRQPVSMLAMMLAFWGVALTCAVAAAAAGEPPKDPIVRPHDQDADSAEV